jgi:hypothetical protein
LYHPIEGQIINNFHELSMREAYRVDLRNGSAMKEKIESMWPKNNSHNVEEGRMLTYIIVAL